MIEEDRTGLVGSYALARCGIVQRQPSWRPSLPGRRHGHALSRNIHRPSSFVAPIRTPGSRLPSATTPSSSAPAVPQRPPSSPTECATTHPAARNADLVLSAVNSVPKMHCVCESCQAPVLETLSRTPEFQLYPCLRGSPMSTFPPLRSSWLPKERREQKKSYAERGGAHQSASEESVRNGRAGLGSPQMCLSRMYFYTMFRSSAFRLLRLLWLSRNHRTAACCRTAP